MNNSRSGLFFAGLLLWILPNLANAQEHIPLTYRYLWDIDHPEEWQMLSRGFSGFGVTGMIWGANDELLLCDRNNAHILRLTREGELVQIIGGEGEGPGEFRDPLAIGIDRQSNDIWIYDESLRRYSIFTNREGTYRYLDSFNAPLRRDNQMNLIIEGADQFWRCGAVRTTFRDPTSTEKSRIKFMDTEGTIVRGFGPLWEVSESSPWAMLGADVLNGGSLVEIPGDRLAFTWMFRPIMEIWTKEGELALQRQFAEPLWETLPVPRQTGEHISSAVSFRNEVRYDFEGNLLFILTGMDIGVSGRALVFVGLDPNTLKEMEIYYVEIPGAKQFKRSREARLPSVEETGIPEFSVMAFLVYRENGEVRFLGADLSTLSLMEFRPEMN
ncbi:6-bladed beta-propeller [Gemmatimonadota bacterium]